MKFFQNQKVEIYLKTILSICTTGIFIFFLKVIIFSALFSLILEIFFALFFIFAYFYYIPRYKKCFYLYIIDESIEIHKGVLFKKTFYIRKDEIIYFGNTMGPISKIFFLSHLTIRIARGKISLFFFDKDESEKILSLCGEKID